METIFETNFGSWVYGTNVENSDTDIKAIHLPPAKEILLQRTTETINTSTKADANQKNSATDIDFESYSLQKFLKLLCEGQTVCMDMLFTPKQWWVKQTPLWLEILANRERFICKQVASFTGYCKTQANKYGIKGSRIASVRAVLDLLKSLPPDDKLILHVDTLRTVFGILEHTGWVSDQKLQPLMECCNRKVPLGNMVKQAIEIYQKVFDQYGHRALQAENNEGVDWKATMHAVRVASQAKELLQTGHISFPRPEASLLLQIRKAELPYKQVAELIEQGLVDVEEAQKNSTLQEKPDYQFAEDLIERTYAYQIITSR